MTAAWTVLTLTGAGLTARTGHTYEVPETDGSPDYLSWLDDETAPR
ncbi:hypothetical protein [Streptomyces sp. RFCAC02]|nr:hypothetical protein [Streptomyces sp. RFCAC02]